MSSPLPRATKEWVERVSPPRGLQETDFFERKLGARLGGKGAQEAVCGLRLAKPRGRVLVTSVSLFS